MPSPHQAAERWILFEPRTHPPALDDPTRPHETAGAGGERRVEEQPIAANALSAADDGPLLLFEWRAIERLVPAGVTAA